MRIKNRDGEAKAKYDAAEIHLTESPEKILMLLSEQVESSFYLRSLRRVFF
jgi:hypothetical protein